MQMLAIANSYKLPCRYFDFWHIIGEAVPFRVAGRGDPAISYPEVSHPAKIYAVGKSFDAIPWYTQRHFDIQQVNPLTYVNKYAADWRFF